MEGVLLNEDDERCPLAPIVEVFGGRWKTEILWCLEQRARRFNELKRSVVGVSQKMLAQQLRQLERDGIVRRELFSEVPARVEYSLTPLGRSLRPVFEKLGSWGQRHMSEVFAARAAYDAESVSQGAVV